MNIFRTVPRQFRRKRVLIVGCGDVGLRCAEELRRFSTVLGTSRSPKCEALQTPNIRALALNLDTNTRASRKHNIAGLASWIIYLVPPSPTGSTDIRLRYFLTRSCNTGHNSVNAKFHSKSKKKTRLVYISTSGVYGDCQGDWLDETRPVSPQSERAIRRLNAERQLRTAGKKGFRISIVRTPGIYASNRLPTEHLQQGKPILLTEEDIYTNHIHADDLANICIRALFYGKPNRVYHASDDSSLKMGDYFDTVAQALGLPLPPRVSAKAIKTQLSASLWSFMRESRRLKNQRIKTELHVRLRYPTVYEGLAVLKPRQV